MGLRLPDPTDHLFLASISKWPTRWRGSIHSQDPEHSCRDGGQAPIIPRLSRLDWKCWGSSFFSWSLFILNNLILKNQVGLVIDKLFDVPCKILHIPSGRALTDHFPLIQEHFKEKASPVMMGGNQDAASKGILGTCTTNDNENYLLVLVCKIISACEMCYKNCSIL